jgi:teichuronic acid biosynthesis glycosyltransferase TuaC
MLKVLMITCEWPSNIRPELVPFLVNEVNKLKKASIQIEVFHFIGNKNPLNYLKAWLDLRKHLEIAKFDVIHAQWGQSALLALPKKKPLVITFRGSDLAGIVGKNRKYTLQGKILQWISKIMAMISDENILVSENLAPFLSNKKYTIIPACIDFDVFRPISQEEARKVINLPLNKKYVLFASSPSRPEKRYDLAKEAVNLLGDSVELLVIEKIPHDSVVYYLNACDILLLTSLHEGSPTIVLEALACNIPVVSVNVGDVYERISNIEGCVVCENDLPSTIAFGLKHVLENNKRICGRETVVKFSTPYFVQGMKTIYEKCASKTRK